MLYSAKKRSISSPVRMSKRQRGQPPNERIERSTNKRKHDMKPGCGNDCKRNCSKIISEEQRMWLHCTCWQIMEKEARLVWMSKFIREKPIAYYFNILEAKRTTTLYCFLPTSGDEESSLVPVCQTFFVNTFGYTVHIIECLRKKFKTFQPCPVQAKIRKSRDQTKIGNMCSSEAGNDTTVVGVQPAESQLNNSTIITDDFDGEL